MDNTVLDKQSVYNDLDNRIERVKSKEAHDEILRLKRLIVSGQFNIPNPLQQQITKAISIWESMNDFDDPVQTMEQVINTLKSLTPTTEPSGADKELIRLQGVEKALQDFDLPNASAADVYDWLESTSGYRPSNSPATEPTLAKRIRELYESHSGMSSVSATYRAAIRDTVNASGFSIPGINAPKGEETV